MIREATLQDAARTDEIDAVSSVYAYQAILPEEILKDLTAENRLPVHQRWIAEKRFEMYVYEDPDTGTRQGHDGSRKLIKMYRISFQTVGEGRWSP